MACSTHARRGASKMPLEHRPLELYNWQSHVAVRTHAPMWLCACNQWLVPHAVPPGAETVCMYLRGGRYTCHHVALSVQPEPHAGPPGAKTMCLHMHGAHAHGAMWLWVCSQSHMQGRPGRKLCAYICTAAHTHGTTPYVALSVQPEPHAGPPVGRVLCAYICAAAHTHETAWL